MNDPADKSIMKRVTSNIATDAYEIIKVHAKQRETTMGLAASELIVRGLLRSGQITVEKAERILRELDGEVRGRRKKRS